MIKINTELKGGAEINRDETYRVLVNSAFEEQLKAKELKETAKALEESAKSKIAFVLDEVGIKKIEADDIGTFNRVTKGTSNFNKKGMKEWLIKKGVDSDLVINGFKANTKKGSSTSINFYPVKEKKS